MSLQSYEVNLLVIYEDLIVKTFGTKQRQSTFYVYECKTRKLH